MLPESVFNNPSLAHVREYCEGRAYLRAVVSLPPETFISSGASVKASLLFMQKFTEEQQADYDGKKVAAEKETREKYEPEITKRTQALEKAIAKAKTDKGVERRKSLQAELQQYQKEMEAAIVAESRALLKSRFPYPIFLYEADHVGITATGETDRIPNELFPNDHMPPGIERSTLELYEAFKANPKPFLAGTPASRVRGDADSDTVLPRTGSVQSRRGREATHVYGEPLSVENSVFTAN